VCFRRCCVVIGCRPSLLTCLPTDRVAAEPRLLRLEELCVRQGAPSAPAHIEAATAPAPSPGGCIQTPKWLVPVVWGVEGRHGLFQPRRCCQQRVFRSDASQEAIRPVQYSGDRGILEGTIRALFIHVCLSGSLRRGTAPTFVSLAFCVAAFQ